MTEYVDDTKNPVAWDQIKSDMIRLEEQTRLRKKKGKKGKATKRKSKKKGCGCK
jgi:hypothetical protein